MMDYKTDNKADRLYYKFKDKDNKSFYENLFCKTYERKNINVLIEYLNLSEIDVEAIDINIENTTISIATSDIYARYKIIIDRKYIDIYVDDKHELINIDIDSCTSMDKFLNIICSRLVSLREKSGVAAIDSDYNYNPDTISSLDGSYDEEDEKIRISTYSKPRAIDPLDGLEGPDLTVNPLDGLEGPDLSTDPFDGITTAELKNDLANHLVDDTYDNPYLDFEHDKIKDYLKRATSGLWINLVMVIIVILISLSGILTHHGLYNTFVGIILIIVLIGATKDLIYNIVLLNKRNKLKHDKELKKAYGVITSISVHTTNSGHNKMELKFISLVINGIRLYIVLPNDNLVPRQSNKEIAKRLNVDLNLEYYDKSRIVDLKYGNIGILLNDILN